MAAEQLSNLLVRIVDIRGGHGRAAPQDIARQDPNHHAPDFPGFRFLDGLCANWIYPFTGCE
jgi:hypothetical protein